MPACNDGVEWTLAIGEFIWCNKLLIRWRDVASTSWIHSWIVRSLTSARSRSSIDRERKILLLDQSFVSDSMRKEDRYWRKWFEFVEEIIVDCIEDNRTIFEKIESNSLSISPLIFHYNAERNLGQIFIARSSIAPWPEPHRSIKPR